MRISDYTNRARLEALHCPLRELCPFAFLCGTQADNGKYVLPSFSSFSAGDMIWTDLGSRRQVYVVRQGLLLNKVYANDAGEVPQAIFGPGMVAGLPELWLPYVASDFYFFSVLVPGQLCTFDGEYVRSCIDGLEVSEAQRVSMRVMTSITTDIYGQILTRSHRRVREKVVSALLRMAGPLSRQPDFDGGIAVTHDDVAFLAGAERATVSKELKGLAREGFIELGYRQIRVLPALRETYGTLIEAQLPFYDSQWGEG